jgi:hypothetical protein
VFLAAWKSDNIVIAAQRPSGFQTMLYQIAGVIKPGRPCGHQIAPPAFEHQLQEFRRKSVTAFGGELMQPDHQEEVFVVHARAVL